MLIASGRILFNKIGMQKNKKYQYTDAEKQLLRWKL